MDARLILKSESGQATTEYIVLLGVVVSIAMVVLPLLAPLLANLGETISDALYERLTTNLYHLRLR
jgi:Flp pilus assembly pilin Flp